MGSKNIKEIQKKLIPLNISNAVELSYFSLLLLMQESNANVSEMKNFRYHSLEESNLWNDFFSNKAELSNKRILCFYAFIEELRRLFSSRIEKGDSDSFYTKQTSFLFVLRVAILATTLQKVFSSDEKLKRAFCYFDVALYNFYSLAIEIASIYEEDCFWMSSLTGVFKNPASVVMSFGKNRFSSNISSWERKLLKYRESIMTQSILDNIFSLSTPIKKSTVGYEDEVIAPNKMVFVSQSFPLWTDKKEGSFFSYIFSKDNKNSLSVLQDMERNYLYFSSSQQGMRDIKRASFSSFSLSAVNLGSNLFQDGTSSLKKREGETREFWDSILSQSSILSLIYVDGLKAFSEILEDFIKLEFDEIDRAYSSIEANEENEEKYKKLIFLFFTNVFHKIKDEIISQGLLPYSAAIQEEDLVIIEEALYLTIDKIMLELRNKREWIV